MKKILLLLSLLFILTVGVKAQNAIPDCDTSKIFDVYPCKVTIKKDGKEYWNVRNSPFYRTTATLSNFSFATITPAKYKWFVVNSNEEEQLSIDNPNKNDGKYIIHIKKKQLKWLNDSTAVYTPFKAHLKRIK